VTGRGDADGETELELEGPGGSVASPGKGVALVSANAGEAEVEGERLEAWRWRLSHAPGAELTATFEISPTDSRRTEDHRDRYLPILEPRLMHLIGSHALPLPAHVDEQAEGAIELAWSGFDEAGWSVLSSHGEGSEPRVVARTPAAFRSAVFLAGDWMVFERDVHGHPLAIAVFGDDWATSLTEFADLAARIVTAQREFFSDFERPYYLISLLPSGERRPGSVSMGGTGLSDSFALFLQRGSALDGRPSQGMSIPWLLAHEMFHDWNGHAISLAQPERLGYWFSEGFTDFYARRLLLRMGFLSPEEHAASWNDRFGEYAANPARNAPAARIEEGFWSDPDLGKLPYHRGDVVALLVDHRIRAASGGARSLDDLMRELVKRSRAGAQPYSVDQLLAAIGELAGPDCAEEVRRIVVDGETVVLPPDVGAPELVLERVELPGFDVGFDHESSMQSGRVTGVEPGSAAERAGLADGQRIAGWSVNFGDVDTPVRVRVREGEQGAEREIEYLPRGAGVLGYRFALRQ
jgi:predicted metalloprotease with PDZ domain